MATNLKRKQSAFERHGVFLVPVSFLKGRWLEIHVRCFAVSSQFACREWQWWWVGRSNRWIPELLSRSFTQAAKKNKKSYHFAKFSFRFFIAKMQDWLLQVQTFDVRKPKRFMKFAPLSACDIGSFAIKRSQCWFQPKTFRSFWR